MEKERVTQNKAFSSSLKHLHEILYWIRNLSIDAGFKEKEIKKIELAVEETFVNIITHACLTKKEIIEIEVSFIKNQEIEITIKDNGLFFNPLLIEPKIDRKSVLEEKVEGGLGILLIKSSVDKMLFQRKNSKNQLILKKKFR